MEVAPSGKLAPAMAARQGRGSCSGSVGPVPGVAKSLPMSLAAFYPTRLGAHDVRPLDSCLIGERTLQVGSRSQLDPSADLRQDVSGMGSRIIYLSSASLLKLS